MTRDGDTYTLSSSGRTFTANRGILGLAPGDDRVYEGYDGEVFWESPRTVLSDEERAEIAIYMIGVWSKWFCGEA